MGALSRGTNRVKAFLYKLHRKKLKKNQNHKKPATIENKF